MNYSVDRLQQFALSAGFVGNDAAIAAAIAMAESGGNPSAYNTEGSYGLWQVDVKFHPQYAGNPSVLFDPATNAHAAYQVWLSAGKSFKPWTTFRCPCNITPCVGTPCYVQFYKPLPGAAWTKADTALALVAAAALLAAGASAAGLLDTPARAIHRLLTA